MQHEGPPLESLTRRLAEAPDDLFLDPRIGTTGRVHAAAVVADLWRLLGLDLPVHAVDLFGARAKQGDRNHHCVTLLLCWLLADDSLRATRAPAGDLWRLLAEEAAELAAGGSARRFTADPERREELARLALARLGLRPAGESVAQAQDRLTSLSSTERARLLEASRAAERRARDIREALARKAAQEAADEWTRE